MRLKILLAALVSVLMVGTYYYGYNKGSYDERVFVRMVLIPLCYMTTSNNKNEFAECMDQNI